jgi:hypothetical protein
MPTTTARSGELIATVAATIPAPPVRVIRAGTLTPGRMPADTVVIFSATRPND